MVKKLVVNKVFSDSEMKGMEGTWIDVSHIKHPVVNDNTDVYYIDDNNNVYNSEHILNNITNPEVLYKYKIVNNKYSIIA